MPTLQVLCWQMWAWCGRTAERSTLRARTSPRWLTRPRPSSCSSGRRESSPLSLLTSTDALQSSRSTPHCRRSQVQSKFRACKARRLAHHAVCTIIWEHAFGTMDFCLLIGNCVSMRRVDAKSIPYPCKSCPGRRIAHMPVQRMRASTAGSAEDLKRLNPQLLEAAQQRMQRLRTRGAAPGELSCRQPRARRS